MGLFSFISSAASAIGSAVKSVASTVGSAVTSIVRNPTDIWMPGPGGILTEVISFIKDLFGNKKYDSSTASVEETKDINRELAKYAQLFHEEAEKLETQALEIANDFFDQFLDKLEEVKGSNDLISHMPIKNIKKEILKLRNELQGSLKKELDQKYSLDNQDLLAILEMDPDANRDRLFQNFSKGVMRKALENLTDKIEEITEIQGEIIASVLQEQIDQISQTIKTENKLLSEIEKSIKAGKKEVAETKANINYTVDLCDVAVNELQSIR